MPVSNAWPERGERIKKGEDKTTEPNDLLEALILMHVSINGPAVSSKEESQLIDRAVKQWNQHLQRKLPKVQRSTPMHVTSVTTSDTQVN